MRTHSNQVDIYILLRPQLMGYTLLATTYIIHDSTQEQLILREPHRLCTVPLETRVRHVQYEGGVGGHNLSSVSRINILKVGSSDQERF